MATDVEVELRDLAAQTRLQGGDETINRLADEVAGTRQSADPINEAYNSLNKNAEDTFRNAIASGVETPAFRTINNDPALQAIRGAKAIHDDPINLYGGRELVSAFQNQPEDQRLDAETFAQRVTIAGALPREYLEGVQKFREKLNQSDRFLFDQEFFRTAADSLKSAYNEMNGTPEMSARPALYYTDRDGHVIGSSAVDSVPGAQAHYFESPEHERVMKKFYESMGIPWTGGVQVTPFNPGFRAKLAGELDKMNPIYPMLANVSNKTLGTNFNPDSSNEPNFGIEEKVKAVREFAAEQASKGLQMFYEAKVGGHSLNALGLLDNVGGPDIETQSAFVRSVAHSLIFEGTSGPSLVALYYTGGASKAFEGWGLLQRVVAEAALNGATNSGISLVGGESDADKLSQDFLVGAFAGAGLSTVLGIVGKAGGYYSRQAVEKELQDAGIIQAKNMVEAAPDGVKVSTDPAVVTNLPESLTDTLRPLNVEMRDATFAAEQATTAANSLARTYSEQGALRDSVMRARRGNAGPVPGEETLVSADAVAEARASAERASERLARAKEAWNQALAENQAQHMADRLDKFFGGETAKGVADLYAGQVRDEIELLRGMYDPSRSTFWLGRAASHFQSALTGVLPGAVGHILTSARSLSVALDNYTRPVMKDLADRANSLLDREMQDIFYVGPKENADLARTHFTELFGSHPEWFKGASAELTTTIRKMVELGNKKLAFLQSIGYPIEAIQQHYFPQFWETDVKNISDSVLRGKVSTAKNRVFADYVEGIRAGLEPKAMTFGQRYLEHDRMLNQAIGDAFERDMLLRTGLAEKGAAMFKRGAEKYAFNSPLYKGLRGKREIVEAIDRVHTVAPSYLESFNVLTQRLKNTALGLFDLGVFGIQLTHAATMGGIPLLFAQVDKALTALNLPGAMALREAVGDVNFETFAAKSGVRQGHVASELFPEAGTVMSYVPVVGKTIDKNVLTKWSDALARLQFDRMLTPVRNDIFRGELFIMHLLHKDIGDAAVQRAAAQAANYVTLAAQTAQSGVRRTFEQSLLVSSSSLRAEFGSVAQLANLFLKGELSRPERIVAAIALTHYALALYAVPAAASIAQGKTPEPFNPLNKSDWSNFGYITIGDKKVAFLKERTIAKAMERAVVALAGGDPEEAGAAWAQAFIGKSSPSLSLGFAMAGVGYESTGQFKTNGLSRQGKLLNLLPFSPLLERAYTDKAARTDPVSMGLEFFGFNNFDVAEYQKRDEYVRAHNPYPVTDARYDQVQQFGYSGMERAEKARFKTEHPEFFTGSQADSGEQSKVRAQLDKYQNDLNELAAEVKDDPYKRRDYKDKRADIITAMAALRSTQKQDFKEYTLQDQAVGLYYDAINQARDLMPGDVLKGDDFGAAEEGARKLVKAKFGDDGIAALDRALAVGTTPLETEYKAARQKIGDSGYYDLADVAAKKEGFDNYADFVKEAETFAKEKNVEVKELPAFTELNSRISKAKLAFRRDHPEVDAMLSIWDGASPQTEAAARMASQVLGRNIDVSESAKPKSKSTRPTPRSAADIDKLIAQFKG